MDLPKQQRPFESRRAKQADGIVAKDTPLREEDKVARLPHIGEARASLDQPAFDARL